MKDFYIKRTNKKIEIFLYCLILLLFLVPFLLINNLIFFEGYDVESNTSVEVGRLKTSNLCYKGFEENLINLNKVKTINTSYRDVYIFPDIENFKCIGKIVDLYIEKDSAEIIIGFNKKVYLYYYNFLVTFIILVFFYLRPIYKKIYFYLFCFLLGYSLLYKYSYLSFDSIGSHPFEIKNDFLFLLIIFFFKNYKNNQVKSIVFIFYLFFNPSLFGILILFIFFANKYSLSNFFMNKKLFFSLPIVFASIRFLSGLSNKTVEIWASLIQDPLTGFSIYPDLQITLTAMNCSDLSFTGNNFLYTGYFLECPVPFYNPLFQFFSISMNLKLMITLFSFLFFIIYLLIYRFLLKQFSENRELIVFTILSPCVNFLFNYGNLDIFTFAIALFALYKFQERWILSTVLIFLIAVNEIHPVGLIFGVLIVSLLRKNYKVLILNSISLFFFIFLLFQDNSEFSVKNQLLNPSQTLNNLDYVGNLGVAYGLSLDIEPILNIFQIQPSLIITLLLIMIAIISVVLFSNKLISTVGNNEYLENGLYVWFIFTIIFSNNSHRLVNFLIIFILIYIKGSNFIKLSVIFSIFLNPNTLIYGQEIANFMSLINRIGIYSIFICFLNQLYRFVFHETSLSKTD